MRKIALIDSDSIIYILAWHARESTDVDTMKRLVDEFMVNIIQDTGATHYLGAFSPKLTFRHRLATIKPYKGNRPPSPPWLSYWKPKIIEQCINDYGFFVADDIEADDILSIMRNGVETNDEVIIISPDKDMKQLPGKHYNYSKKTWATITEAEATYKLWWQILVGDTGDNITGAKGIGEKGANKILSVPAEQYEDAVKAAFQQVYKENWESVYLEIVSLVQLVGPSKELVDMYGSKIQSVAIDSSDEVQDLLNNADGILQSDQRSYEGNLLRPPLDISEQV